MVAGACAKFDKGEGLGRLACGLGDDLIRVGGEDAALRSGEVVLGKLGDLLEEVRTGLVVEEPGGESFWAGGEAARASWTTASLVESKTSDKARAGSVAVGVTWESLS